MGPSPPQTVLRRSDNVLNETEHKVAFEQAYTILDLGWRFVVKLGLRVGDDQSCKWPTNCCKCRQRQSCKNNELPSHRPVLELLASAEDQLIKKFKTHQWIQRIITGLRDEENSIFRSLSLRCQGLTGLSQTVRNSSLRLDVVVGRYAVHFNRQVLYKSRRGIGRENSADVRLRNGRSEA
jgi:hypothetical protein